MNTTLFFPFVLGRIIAIMTTAFVLFLSGGEYAKAQVAVPSAKTATQTEYKSLERALQNPDKVYRLNLSGMMMTELPADIAKLKNLQYLDLSFNQLDSLPKELCTLNNLETLNVLFNQITRLPDEFSTLKKLRNLNIANNKISEVPIVLTQLTGLQNLDIAGNSLQAGMIQGMLAH